MQARSGSEAARGWIAAAGASTDAGMSKNLTPEAGKGVGTSANGSRIMLASEASMRGGAIYRHKLSRQEPRSASLGAFSWPGAQEVHLTRCLAYTSVEVRGVCRERGAE